MVRVYIAQHIQEAYLVKILLEREGISSEVKNEILGSFVGEIPASETYTEVWVDDNDATSARKIIADEDKGLH